MATRGRIAAGPLRLMTDFQARQPGGAAGVGVSAVGTYCILDDGVVTAMVPSGVPCPYCGEVLMDCAVSGPAGRVLQVLRVLPDGSIEMLVDKVPPTHRSLACTFPCGQIFSVPVP